MAGRWTCCKVVGLDGLGVPGGIFGWMVLRVEEDGLMGGRAGWLIGWWVGRV